MLVYLDFQFFCSSKCICSITTRLSSKSSHMSVESIRWPNWKSNPSPLRASFHHWLSHISTPTLQSEQPPTFSRVILFACNSVWQIYEEFQTIRRDENNVLPALFPTSYLGQYEITWLLKKHWILFVNTSVPTIWDKTNYFFCLRCQLIFAWCSLHWTITHAYWSS